MLPNNCYYKNFMLIKRYLGLNFQRFRRRIFYLAELFVSWVAFNFIIITVIIYLFTFITISIIALYVYIFGSSEVHAETMKPLCIMLMPCYPYNILHAYTMKFSYPLQIPGFIYKYFSCSYITYINKLITQKV